MLEKVMEQKLVRAVKAAGGLCPKFVSPGMDGMPGEPPDGGQGDPGGPGGPGGTPPAKPGE